MSEDRKIKAKMVCECCGHAEWVAVPEGYIEVYAPPDLTRTAEEYEAEKAKKEANGPQ